MALSKQLEVIAALLAAGRKNKEIAKVVGLSEVRISQIRHEPLIRTRVEQIRSEQTATTLQDAFGYLREELPKSLRTLSDLRDDEEVDPAVRRNCARDLAFEGFLDRVVPKGGGGGEGGKANYHFHVEGEQLQKILGVMREVEGETIELPKGSIEGTVGIGEKRVAGLLPAPETGDAARVDHGHGKNRRIMRPMSPEEFREEWERGAI